MNKLFVISRYKEDFRWIERYTDNYLVYNKGNAIDDSRVINLPNIGGNQHDICHFIYYNYELLPDIMIFLQAHPFDHCKAEIFNNLIKLNTFVGIESHEDSEFIGNRYGMRSVDGGVLEKNREQITGDTSHTSYDAFMEKYFEDYIHVDWMRFSPGSQYVVPKENALIYPKRMWISMCEDLKRENSHRPFLGHMVERALYYIFTGKYSLRKEFYD